MKLNLDPDPGAGGGGNSDWKASLPDDLKASPVLQKFKTPEDAYRAHINLESVIGHKRLVVPDAKADEKTWEDVYNQLGRPPTPDKYPVPEFKFEEGLQ